VQCFIFQLIALVHFVPVACILFLFKGYKKPGEVNPKYLIPFYDSLFPFLPECIRKPLRCGYDYTKSDYEVSNITYSARFFQTFYFINNILTFGVAKLFNDLLLCPHKVGAYSVALVRPSVCPSVRPEIL
jgi:hypothetical protein